MSDEALELAGRLLEEKSYDGAIMEGKRFMFFNPEDERVSDALYIMGLAYRAVHNWRDAINAFRESIRTTKDIEVADERRITLAATLIASGNYSLARLELLNLLGTSVHAKALYFDGIASLYMFDWDATERAFNSFYSEYADSSMRERAESVNQILPEVRGSRKSVNRAVLLSTILPGLGQAYSGNWRDALNALALNGLTIGLLAKAIYRKDAMDIVLIFPISLRYYAGNRYRARIDAKEYNRSLDRQNALRILNLVREDEP